MQIGNVTVTTPEDNPVQFDPDWRSSVAAAFVDYPGAKIDADYRTYKNDPWVRKQMEYLKAVRTGRTLTKAQRAFRYAARWAQGSSPSDVKFKLEPLLLTAVPLNVIVLDIGGGAVDPDAFSVYEKLYFNIRQDGGDIHKSCHLRTYFAMPTGTPNPTTPDDVVWRMIGANMGYDVLVSSWLWSDAHGLTNKDPGYMLQALWCMAQSRLFMDLFTRRVDHFNLSNMMKAVTENARMRHDTSTTADVDTEILSTAMALLRHTAPTVLNTAKEVDSLDDLTEAIRARLKVEKSDMIQDTGDRGKQAGIAGLNEMLAANFKSKRAN